MHDGLFSLCGDRKESVIAKNLQRSRDFCFHDGWIAPTGRFRNGRIAETGQIMQMCGFPSATAWPGIGLPIRRSGSLGHAASGGAGQVERQREQRGLAASRVERQRRRNAWGYRSDGAAPGLCSIGLGGGNSGRGPRVGLARREVRIFKLWAEAPIRQKINLFRHD